MHANWHEIKTNYLKKLLSLDKTCKYIQSKTAEVQMLTILIQLTHGIFVHAK